MPFQGSHFYEFGPFRMDTRKRVLTRDGRSMPLTPKAFQTLAALVEHSGRTVEKEHLMEMLWPDTFVEEANLSQHVFQLRKVLGESPDDHQYILTVPGRGYRFVAEVRRVAENGDKIEGETGGEVVRVEERSRSSVLIEEEYDDGQPENCKDRYSTARAAGASFPLSSPIAGPGLEIEKVPAPRSVHNQAAFNKVIDPVRSVLRIASRRTATSAGIALALMAASALVYFAFLRPQSSPPISATPRTLAILPFRNLKPDAESDFLGFLLADSIINRLSNVGHLTVRPSSYIGKYRNQDIDPREIARDLKVDSLLSGTFLKDGDDLRVTTQLIDLTRNQTIWQDQIDLKYGKLLTLEDRVADSIVAGLKLSGEVKIGPPRHTTENAEAYQAYLKGRFFWNKRSTDGFRKAVEYFQYAIDKDPGFALAYAGLADAYLMDNAVKAEPVLRKALELDNALGEAHASLGFNRMFWNWDWADAEREFKIAIRTTPNYATAHQWYGIYLAARGRLDEAKAEMRRALELDPLSPIINADMGQVYYFSREYDQAAAACRKALEIDPDSIIAHQYLYRAYTQLGRPSEAVEEFLKYAATRSPAAAASLRHAFAISGWRGFLQDQLDYWKESKVSPLDRTEKAVVYGKLGDKGQAIEQLERAYDERSFFLVFLKVEPRYDDLAADRQFQDLLQRVGLAP